MVKKNQEVDQYIENSAEFAQPILKRLRTAFHKGCPQVEETIKWGIPTFEYHGILGSIAAFKNHVSVGFWRSRDMDDPAEILKRRAASMCNAKFTTLKELPKLDILKAYVSQAANLNEKGKPKKRAPTKRLPPIPPRLKSVLDENPKAKTQFASMSPSQKRDYIEWINEAKREATVTKRIATAIEWIAEGKGRNWKYEPKKSAAKHAAS